MNNCRKLFGLSWLFWVLALATLLFVGGLVLFRWQIAYGQTPSGGTSADQNFIQGLRQALSSSRLSAADRQALQKKLEYSERLVAQQEMKPETRRPKGALIPPVPMPTLPAEYHIRPEERILPGSESMIHSWEASINNLWEGSYNGIPYHVLAGSSPDDPTQGLVIVFEYPSGQEHPIRKTYLVPSRSGALSIMERQGSRLRCAAADGSILFFDLETRAFQ